MATTKIPSPTATAIAAPTSSLTHQSLYLFSKLPFPTLPISRHHNRPITKLHVSSPPNKTPATAAPTKKPKEETVFFDGGAHYGDLLANLLLGFTLFWLPLTLAAVSRAFNLRYRFTNLRVTVISGLTGEDRSDFSYKVIKDVQVVPRFIGSLLVRGSWKTLVHCYSAEVGTTVVKFVWQPLKTENLWKIQWWAGRRAVLIIACGLSQQVARRSLLNVLESAGKHRRTRPQEYCH